jgi:hypothetical protein
MSPKVWPLIQRPVGGCGTEFCWHCKVIYSPSNRSHLADCIFARAQTRPKPSADNPLYANDWDKDPEYIAPDDLYGNWKLHWMKRREGIALWKRVERRTHSEIFTMKPCPLYIKERVEVPWEANGDDVSPSFFTSARAIRTYISRTLPCSKLLWLQRNRLWGYHNSPTHPLLEESTQSFCNRSRYASIQNRTGRNHWGHQEIPIPLEDRKSWISSLLVILSSF